MSFDSSSSVTKKSSKNCDIPQLDKHTSGSLDRETSNNASSPKISRLVHGTCFKQKHSCNSLENKSFTLTNTQQNTLLDLQADRLSHTLSNRQISLKELIPWLFSPPSYQEQDRKLEVQHWRELMRLKAIFPPLSLQQGLLPSSEDCSSHNAFWPFDASSSRLSIKHASSDLSDLFSQATDLSSPRSQSNTSDQFDSDENFASKFDLSSSLNPKAASFIPKVSLTSSSNTSLDSPLSSCVQNVEDNASSQSNLDDRPSA